MSHSQTSSSAPRPSTPLAPARDSWEAIALRVLDGAPATHHELMAILESGDDDLLAVMQAAYRIRHRFHGRRVKVHVLQNAKSGLCPENCSFCSQSVHNQSDVDRYKMQSIEELLEGARRAFEAGAVTYCMVTSTRGPTGRELETVCDATRQIKQRYPLKVCASLGLLRDGQAERLREAGVDRYNHNIESSERHFPHIATTHTWGDRVQTVMRAKEAGLEACCGGIVGLGEDRADRVDLAMALHEIGVESVPVNFIDPRPGTPMAEHERLTPNDCLRTLAMFRFANPEADVRMAGGREVSLGALQPLALYAANSLFTDGYLTTPGAAPNQDWRMIEQAGFEGELASW